MIFTPPHILLHRQIGKERVKKAAALARMYLVSPYNGDKLRLITK